MKRSIKNTGKTCTTTWVTFPTSVIDTNGTYVAAHRARAVVCRNGRGVGVVIESPVLGSIKLTKSMIEREAVKYARLSKSLECPSARAVARELANEWRGFASEVSKISRALG